MKKVRKNNGFILPMVIIITIFIFAITVTVTMLSFSHSNDIIKDNNRSKNYYIANSGLEIVYAALNQGSPSIIESTGIKDSEYFTPNNTTKTEIVKQKKIEIKSNDGKIMGYATVKGDLINKDGNFYYKIESVGSINSDTTNQTPMDTHLLTMIIEKNNPNKPRVYDGKKTDL